MLVCCYLFSSNWFALSNKMKAVNKSIASYMYIVIWAMTCLGASYRLHFNSSDHRDSWMIRGRLLYSNVQMSRPWYHWARNIHLMGLGVHRHLHKLRKSFPQILWHCNCRYSLMNANWSGDLWYSTSMYQTILWFIEPRHTRQFGKFYKQPARSNPQ